MEVTIQILEYVTLAAFAALAVVTWRKWREEKDPPSQAAFRTFAVIATVAVFGTVIPQEDSTIVLVLEKLLVATLLLFPYFLFQLSSSFGLANRTTDRLALGLTAIVMGWVVFLPELPDEGERGSTAWQLFVAALLVQWVVLSLIVAVRFWRAGRGQPFISRRRMRMLSVASVALSVVIVIAGAAPTEHSDVLDLMTQLITLSSVGFFFFAFAPPRWLRTLWRRPAQEELRRAAIQLMADETDDEVAEGLLPVGRNLVGSEAIAVLDKEGQVLAVEGFGDDLRSAIDELPLDEKSYRTQIGTEIVALGFDFGWVVVRTSPFTMLFGRDEIEFLGALGALANLALDRVRTNQLRWQIAQARMRRRQALEINDNIVQGLTVAQYALFMGEHEKGMKAIEGTLDAARTIITDLMEEAAQTGALDTTLVREQAATGFTGGVDGVPQRRAEDRKSGEDEGRGRRRA